MKLRFSAASAARSNSASSATGVPGSSGVPGVSAAAGFIALPRLTALPTAAALCTLLLPAVGAQAAEPGPMEQVLVSAARVPAPGSQIGSAWTVLDREQIALRQVRYVTDLLRTVPGFAVSQSGGTGTQTQVRVRGSESNHVLVLIDGVRANDAATSDDFRWEHLSTGDIERLEIIRGPQSALWGSDAVSAVVNIVTSGQAERSQLDGYAETGANNTRNGRLDGRWVSGDWQWRAAVESLQTDGINISRVGSERDGSELNTLNLGARYANDHGLVVDGSLRATDAVSAFDPTDFVNTGLPADADRETHSDSWVGRVNAALGSSEDRVIWRLRAAVFDSRHRNFADGLETNRTGSERTTLTAQADIRLFADDTLSLAVERETTDFEQRGEVGFGDPNQEQTLRLHSAMFEYRRPQTAGLSWSLSGRYDDYNAFEDAFTGKLSAVYAFDSGTLVRANVGSGQKTPTFTERFGFFPDQFIGNPELKPERSVSYDLGLSQPLADGRGNLDLTLFRQDLRDEIDGFVFDPVSFLSTADNLSGKSRRSGVELAAQWAFSDALSANAMYTYTDGSEEDASGRSITELRRPRHTGSLSLSYAPAGGRASGTLVADYSSERRDRFFPPFPAASQVVRLGEVWLLEATAQYRVLPGLTVYARGTNLLDEQYEQVFGYRTLGRAAWLGVRADFTL